MKLLASIAGVDANLPIDGFGNILSYGLQMMLIGMATIFAALTIIWIALVCFKYLFSSIEKNKSSKNTENDVSAAPAPAPAQIQDTELVAVIAAAIAAAESENNGAKFRVVSFRRK